MNIEYGTERNADIIDVERSFKDFMRVVDTYLQDASEVVKWTSCLDGIALWWTKPKLSELTQISYSNQGITRDIIMLAPRHVQDSWMAYCKMTEACCASLIDLVLAKDKRVSHFADISEFGDLRAVLLKSVGTTDTQLNELTVNPFMAGNTPCALSSHMIDQPRYEARSAPDYTKIVCVICGTFWYDYTGVDTRTRCLNCSRIDTTMTDEESDED